MSDEATQQALVERLAAALRARGAFVATAESCTGGLIAAACTSLAGSSEWFERGFVTYSNEAKTGMLGVAPALIAAYGAVSAEVACAMAEGAIVHSRASFAVSVTGVAGPAGGSVDKPVGTVWIAVAKAGSPARAERRLFDGDRTKIREATVVAALQCVIAQVLEG